MLEVLRSSAKGNVGKVIVGLIVVTFVLFGAESIISIAGNSAPATVNGEDISEVDFQRLMSNRQQELANQFGAEAAAQLANSPFLREEVINSLINQALQSQLASNLQLEVSDEMVMQSFADIAAFQLDGKFDQNMYLNALAGAGYSHMTFIAAQKNQYALNQMQIGLVNSAFTVDKVAERYSELNAQQREVSFYEFNADDFKADVVLSDEDLDAYYQENQQAFLSEEQVKVNYVLLTLNDIAAEIIVSENDLKAAYDSFVVEYKANEVREISHILFSDGDVEAEVAAAQARLIAGESFADLAAELSDDPGSAEFGGSLGELIPGIYVEEFYQAAIELNEAGDISAPVKTQFGTHLIKLDALSTVVVPSFDEKKDELTAQIQQEKARNEMLLVESQLSDEAFASDFIADVAESFQTSVQSSDWLTQSGNSGLFADINVISAAFSEQVVEDGLISEVVRLSNGDLIAMQKTDYQPEAVLPYEEVAESVEAAVTEQKANELMLAALASVVDQQSVTGEGWSEAILIDRSNTDLPRSVVEVAFTMAAPEAGGVSVSQAESGNVAYAVAVSDVVNVTPDEDTVLAAQNFAQQVSGGAQYQMLFNQQRNEAKIKIRQ